VVIGQRPGLLDDARWSWPPDFASKYRSKLPLKLALLEKLRMKDIGVMAVLNKNKLFRHFCKNFKKINQPLKIFSGYDLIFYTKIFKENVSTIEEIRLDNYDPLESDPREYGREKFCGDLNRYLLNGKKFVDAGDHGRFPYDSVTWKSAIQLYYHFFDKAVEERKKKNYAATIHHLDVAQALDLEPNKHVCNGYNPYSKYGIQVGPNPGLAMLRAESYLQMNK
jgi:hypothetical protein